MLFFSINTLFVVSKSRILENVCGNQTIIICYISKVWKLATFDVNKVDWDDDGLVKYYWND